MIRTVECSSCSASFPVDPRKVPDEGVYARCSACSAVFFVEGGVAAAALAAPAQMGGTDQGFDAGRSDDGFAVESNVPDFSSSSVAAPEPPKVETTDEWVFETEPDVDSTNLRVERLDTIEERQRQTLEGAELGPLPTFEPETAAPPPPPPPPAPVFEPVKAAPPPPPPAPAAPAPVKSAGFTFGRRDPHEKASRLARVLVSDIITYNPERHQRALDGGTLKADFDDEIKKSWGEYVDQVGKEIAESTNYFNQALNEILARGQNIF